MKISTLAILITGILFFTACGGGESNTPSKPTQPTSEDNVLYNIYTSTTEEGCFGASGTLEVVFGNSEYTGEVYGSLRQKGELLKIRKNNESQGLKFNAYDYKDKLTIVFTGRLDEYEGSGKWKDIHQCTGTWEAVVK